MPRFVAVCSLVLLPLSTCGAGYEQPNFVDGCRSSNGRFEVTAEQTQSGKGTHGPNAWEFTWKDTKSGETRTYPATGVQGGQIYAHLYVAPDGETFALWNHVTMFWPEKSASHASGKLPKKPEPGTETDEWKNQDVFSHRINVYRSKNGELVRSLAVVDLLEPAEWETVLPVFNRVHWCREYPCADGEKKINFKKAPRPGYAFHRISPDYTVLEFQATTSRAKRREPPRVVRVDLTTGRVIPPEKWSTDESKVPVRPYVGDDEIPAEGKANVWKESFVPSLDPVREAYHYEIESEDVQPTTPTSLETAPTSKPAAADSIDPNSLKLELVVDGFQKSDTPAWVPSTESLFFTDLTAGEMYEWKNGRKPEIARKEAVRAKTGPDGRLYGIFNGKLATWRPGHDPEVIAETAADGRPFSLNDIAVSKSHVYFSTLKDPEKGRLSIVDRATGKVTVAFDGAVIPELANPNGLALSPDGRFLYVVISNYKARKHSAVYRFPVEADGSLDVDTGRAAKWAAIKAPDGIATTPDGRVWFTAGGTIHVYSPDAKPVGKVKIPKGSGTNLSFGGENGRTLFVTTWNALYVARPE